MKTKGNSKRKTKKIKMQLQRNPWKLVFLAIAILLSVLVIFAYFIKINSNKLVNGIVSEKKIILNSENVVCKEFEDNVLFSSGYTHYANGSINYRTWKIGTHCNLAGGKNCLLQNVSIDVRYVYSNPYAIDTDEINNKNKGIDYVQISNPDESICNKPENGFYSTYLFYKSIDWPQGEKELFCEKVNDLFFECVIRLDNSLNNNIGCYGIKLYSSQYVLIDVLKIKYNWCWDKKYSENIEVIKK